MRDHIGGGEEENKTILISGSQEAATTGKTHIRPRPLVPVTALAGTNVQF